MTIKRIPLLSVEENRQRRGKVPLSPAHRALIEALADAIAADLEANQPPAEPAPEKGRDP